MSACQCDCCQKWREQNAIFLGVDWSSDATKEFKIKALRDVIDKYEHPGTRICGGNPWEAKAFIYTKDIIKYIEEL